MTAAATLPVKATPKQPDCVFLELATTPKGQHTVANMLRFTPSGALKRMLVRMPISEEQGDVHNIEGNRTISAICYDRVLNKMGALIRLTKTVHDDEGGIHHNPYTYWEPGKTWVHYIRYRMIGVHRNALGNLQLTDYVLTYNLRAYFVRDLMTKWKKRGKTAMAWGRLCDLDREPKLKDNEKLIVGSAGLGLIVDMTHADFQDAFKEHFNRQNFASSLAFTLCRRNLTKKMTALSRVDETNVLSFVGWVESDAVAHAVDGLVESDDIGDGSEIAGEKIERTSASDIVDSPDDMVGVTDEDGANEQPVDDAVPAPGVDLPTAKPSNGDEVAKLRQRILDGLLTLKPPMAKKIEKSRNKSLSELREWVKAADKADLDTLDSVIQGLMDG